MGMALQLISGRFPVLGVSIFLLRLIVFADDEEDKDDSSETTALYTTWSPASESTSLSSYTCKEVVPISDSFLGMACRAPAT